MNILLLFVFAVLTWSHAAQSYSRKTWSITLTDSKSGNAISNSVCSLYDEGNALVASGSSEPTGCSVTAPACNGGACPVNFHLIVVRDGYYTLHESGLRRSSDVLNFQLTSKLTNEVNIKEMRVVLSWGYAHSDLDSHMLVPPNDASDDMCEVFYRNKECSQGSSRAILDVDDIDYLGPETTTLRNPHPGVYSYFVHIYDGGGKCWDTSGIAAQVEVWSGEEGGLIERLSQPVENPETHCQNGDAHQVTCHQFWHVFDYDATTNQFNWKNTMVEKIPTTAREADEAFLPPLADCTCRAFSGGSGGGLTTWWSQQTTSAAADLSEKLLGEAGIAGTSMCHALLQDVFTDALIESNPTTAAVVANDLAEKVSER